MRAARAAAPLRDQRRERDIQPVHAREVADRAGPVVVGGGDQRVFRLDLEVDRTARHERRPTDLALSVLEDQVGGQLLTGAPQKAIEGVEALLAFVAEHDVARARAQDRLRVGRRVDATRRETDLRKLPLIQRHTVRKAGLVASNMKETHTNARGCSETALRSAACHTAVGSPPPCAARSTS